jgi:ATP-dependent Lhr-like helicase
MRSTSIKKKIDSALSGFHAPVQDWFSASFEAPTRVQELGWPAIQSGSSTLILAPTGSGKTLAAFLVAIDRLMFSPIPPKMDRCRVLYISPLKALAVDVERNLRAPLVGVSRYAERMGEEVHTPEVAIRTGDTPSRDRAAFNRAPSDILITTPESLFLLLTSNAREALRSIECVIIDEIHAMVGTKRGAHLALSLERLQEIANKPFQRIGLSATQRPLDEVARFLGGFEDPAPGALVELDTVPSQDKPSGDGVGVVGRSSLVDGHENETVEEGIEIILGEDDDSLPHTHTPILPHSATQRPIQIVDAGKSKQLDLLVEVPVEDMARLGEVQEIPSGPAAQGETRTSIWPAIHPLILNLIRTHTSTLIFVNSRRLAERLASALNELAGEEIVHAHHGSIAREQRLLIEDQLKSGKLPAMVATSSLELGIDMGAIDLVIQVEAPPSVASGIQRIGRAGHHIGVPSKGIILPKYRGDLLACAALTERMQSGAVEHMRYLRNPLDILAQQIVAMVAMDDWRVEDLERVIRRSAPFAELPTSMLEQVLDMLSGRYPSDEFAELRPRITWDRLNGVLHSREGAKRIAITNGGTIPDRGLYGVFLIGAEKGHGRVGELDEEMVFESKVGDIFLLGASSWRIEEITHDRVVVSPAPGVPGRMPFWHGESAGRPLEFGKAIGALTRTLRSLPYDEAMELLKTKHSLDESAARNLLQYLEDQVEAAGAAPDDRNIVVESYRDEMGDWRVCILSPFGGKVHAPWAMAIGAMVRDRSDFEVDILWTDDGIVVRFPETDEPPDVEWVLPDPEEVEDLVIRQLSAGGGGAHEAHQGAPVNALFASRFREAAARALLLPRRHPGQRAPLWQQRKRAADLLKATSKFGSFPIVLETFRECLQDVFDMPALVSLLTELRSREIRVIPVTTRTPSPFAAALMFNYVANFIYEGDSPLAERRAQALLVDPSQLRELLGEAELRELLDADALEALELYLQHLTPERTAKHADGLHDLLIRLGDLSHGELMARVTSQEAAMEWIARLEKERRIVTLTIAGEPRFVAAEDAGRYRDALGIPPPPGLPTAFLDYAHDPLGDLISRYLRTHGPFQAQEVANRYGIGVGPVTTTLQKMASRGRVVEGEFRPGGSGREWCDTGVLRALRQKSLARLRQEVEPVEQSALGRLYLSWQGVRRQTTNDQRPMTKAPLQSDRNSLLDVIEQLQDASLPASELERSVLPARLAKFDPRELDQLTASGEVIWVGCEPLGQHDGRISLYLAEHAPLLLKTDRVGGRHEEKPVHQAIREHLATRGASFFPAIFQASGGGLVSDVVAALWDLVWAGEVTNDTLQPLRDYLNPRRIGNRRNEERRRTPRRSILVRGFKPMSSTSTARGIPPEAAGRWSLVSSLVFGEATPTERMTARAQQLLSRYGVLTREAVQAEGIEGGFSAVYGVLKAMEEAGRVRRGYFVSGLGATQFSLPGVVDRLRSLREPPEEMESILLAATDPANPYGASLSWPERPEGRKPMRMVGASVLLIDGALAAWVSRGERQLLTFMDSFLEQFPERQAEEVWAEIARVLAAEVAPGKRRAFFVEEVDGKPTADSAIAPALLEAGFIRTSHGYLKRL